ncbi:sugar phosphate nucleotidyltransferase [Paludicola sp. MB14-C6]|uniref:sugar phosphate nucleotidyltransferase n=1 Tax=Paludihabitans sp. MB14-C6 TaxID=3070656 RepID=UPI0027DC2BF5|nr:sugar phosphate nucleotidyltransferase [Paludicola sp. MB14-C6]WMJ24133.1 sugar phosphate nucleotidyltransferase [Paludicola sp. MB14-C6]
MNTKSKREEWGLHAALPIKACIMAGGKGTRLQPLTIDMPKPLATLLGKPIVFYIIELLQKHGIQDAVMTLGFQGQMLQQIVSESKYVKSMNMEYVHEKTPLGTAGGVKNAMGNYEGTLLVISGDAMCDFDLAKAIEFHRLNDSVATIIVKQVEDPREYGLINCNMLGKIEGFIEKPSYKSCTSDLASTGIYILSSEVLSMIPSDRPVDFAKDIFPKLLKEGYSLYAYQDHGYWCDIGDIKSYTQCQKDMLNGIVQCNIEAENYQGIYAKRKPHFNGVTIHPPVYIGDKVTIGKESVIGKGSILCDQVAIGQDVTIQESILLTGCHVGDHAVVEGAVCCDNTKIERECILHEGSVIGSDSLIKSGAVIESGVKVWPNKSVSEGIKLREDLHFGIAKDITIDDEGIIGQANAFITPTLCTKIGSGVASLKDDCIIGVGYSDNSSSIAFYYAVISGILAAGGTAWLFDCCIETQFHFCMQKSMVDFGIYIDGGTVSRIKIYEKGAMPTSRPIERMIEGAMNRGEYKRVSANQMGNVVNMQSLRELYAIELLKLCNTSLEGIRVCVKSSNSKVKQLMEECLVRLGCELGDGITIRITASGNGISLSYEGKNYLFHERVLALVCLSEFLKGESVAVANTAPMIIDQLAAVHGQSVYRYNDCPCNEEDHYARQKAIIKPFLRDGLMMAVKVLSFMKSENVGYDELVKLIPEFSVSSRLVSVSISPSVILKKLACEKKIESEGVMATKDGKTAYIRPIKSGKGLMIFSESFQSETAVEICDIFENMIKDTPLDS